MVDAHTQVEDERQALRDRKTQMRANAVTLGWGAEFDQRWAAHNIGPASTNAEIRAALDTIEPPFDHQTPPPVERSTPVPLEPTVDNGPPVAKSDIDALLAHIKTSDHRDTINQWLREGNRGGNSWDPRTHPDVRRYQITRAALALATASDGRDDIAHLILNQPVAAIDNVDRFVSLPIGCVLGLLTIEEAVAVHTECDAFIAGRYLLLYDHDGHPYLQAAA